MDDQLSELILREIRELREEMKDNTKKIAKLEAELMGENGLCSIVKDHTVKLAKLNYLRGEIIGGVAVVTFVISILVKYYA